MSSIWKRALSRSGSESSLANSQSPGNPRFLEDEKTFAKKKKPEPRTVPASSVRAAGWEGRTNYFGISTVSTTSMTPLDCIT
ncbi:MAG TPA: hypothetical protein VFV07_08230, partial [Rhizomicrobium sp.]|nr:hypothetical protein [Rhizomicrobium sp.]